MQKRPLHMYGIGNPGPDLGRVHKMWQRRIYKLKIDLKIVSIIQVFRGNLPVNIFLMDDC
jgi:hypothetical protein